ncbi:MAG: dihydroorotate dehydrogenase [Firmicutes bacterium]|nr:dihydroorotate dehydrogenase [Bacillota bacterium]MCL5039291.1 dihydroorotate dehydrogenase [Bacillota bacterium]
MTSENKQVAVRIGDLFLQNPVLTASGTFDPFTYAELVDLNRLGALVLKGLTLQPVLGNKPPRIAETPAGLLNSIGFQNPGLEGLLRDILPRLKDVTVPIIANISGDTEEEYEELASRLNHLPEVAALEVNISCPNVARGGMVFGTDPEVAFSVVSRVRRVYHKTLIVKLSPNVTDIAAIARRVEAAGADAVSLINTLLGMAIDVRTRRPRLGNVTGGLSGPAIRPVAVRMVWQVARAVRIPIIGMGGITSAEDALEFLLAGARAVGVGAANLVDPRATMEIIEGLERFLEEEGIKDINELVGAVRV